MDTPSEASLLTEFLTLFEQVPKELVAELLRVTTDEDHRLVVNALAPTLTNQFKEIAAHLRVAETRSSRQQTGDAEHFLKLSSATTLTSGLKVALPSIGSLIGKLGISGIVMEIKKIITKLFEIFHIKLPQWVLDLVNLIDEIFHHMLGDSIKTKTALSRSEQNYLAELTQLARLKNATRAGANDDEDDDD